VIIVSGGAKGIGEGHRKSIGRRSAPISFIVGTRRKRKKGKPKATIADG